MFLEWKETLLLLWELGSDEKYIWTAIIIIIVIIIIIIIIINVIYVIFISFEYCTTFFSCSHLNSHFEVLKVSVNTIFEASMSLMCSIVPSYNCYICRCGEGTHFVFSFLNE